MVDKYAVIVRWRHVMLGAVLMVSVVQAEAENKWVWSGNSRTFPGGGTARYYPDEVGQPLHRPPAPVFEVTDFTNPPPILQPSKPISTLPNNNGPLNFPRPGTSGILTGPDNLRPGRPGILTGPVPSWEQNPADKFAYKDYDHCKCAYAFNCASPGIKFGQCDSGKQYCCYNSKPVFYGRQPPPNTGLGYVDPPVKPTYNRPVLVGPDGPTGLVSEGGRPFKPPGGFYGPLLTEDFEEGYRQNGRPYQGLGTINDEHFPRPAYDPYARSANIDAKKNGKKL